MGPSGHEVWIGEDGRRWVTEAEFERVREAARAANQALRDYNRNGITWMDLDRTFARLEALLNA